MWTSKHLKYAISKRLTGCALYLWQWIVESEKKAEDAQPIEINLKDFNNFVEKRRGKGFDPHTLKLAVGRLINAKVLEDLSLPAFKWFWRRVKVRSVAILAEGLKPPKRRSEKIPTAIADADLQPCNAATATAEDNTSSSSTSDLDKKIELCRSSVGANYTKREARFLAAFSWEQITAAIKYTIAYGLHKIERPCGWLRWALESNQAEIEAERAYYSAKGGTAYSASEFLQAVGVE